MSLFATLSDDDGKEEEEEEDSEGEAVLCVTRRLSAINDPAATLFALEAAAMALADACVHVSQSRLAFPLA